MEKHEYLPTTPAIADRSRHAALMYACFGFLSGDSRGKMLSLICHHGMISIHVEYGSV